MKKLVKTAKQQFEERLSNFINPIKEVCHYSTYYLCTDEQGFCVILYSYNEGEANVYKEFSFGKKLDDIYTDEDFLCFIVDYWSEYISSPIKELFEWYASADRENTPFSIDIILQFAKVCNKTIFEDLYEEIPDVRIITAKEQWEEASADAKVLTLDEEHTLKVKITDKNVVFYRSDDMYARIEYPSLEQMRADTCFVCEVTDSMNEANMQDDIAKFLRWVRVGGDFPIPLSVIFYSDYQNYKFEGYEDKELHQEQTIEEMIALTPEQQDAVKAFEVAFEALKDSGVKIICYTDENDFYAINGNANLEFENLYNDKDGYIEITHTLEDNHRFPFAWNLYWGHDYGFYAKKL